MKKFGFRQLNILSFCVFLVSITVVADTPPPGTVKAKTYSGDGNTAITATGGSLDVHVTNSSGLSTVNQGDAGVEAWLAAITSSVLPTNACQESGGHLASIDAKLSTPMPVSGTFWQTTQPVSLASLPALATGANTIGAVNVNGTVPVSGTFWQATQPVSGTVTANAGTGTFTVDASGHTVPVSGTFWQATQPVSAASLPLPSGASTEAKQPALGIAGTPSSDVLTVQGASGMTALKTDGSGVTQPVSGTVTANAGSGTFTVDASGHTVPVSGTFWQATQPVSGTVTANIGTSGSLALDASVTGLQVSQGSSTSGEKGALTFGAVTTAAPSYTTAQSSPLSLTTAGGLRIDGSGTTQPVSGTVTANAGTGTFTVDGSGHTQPVSGTFWQTTQPVSLTTLPALTASSAIVGKVGIDQTTPGTTNGVQVNAALPAGSNVIGHVIVDTAPTTAVTQSGTFTVQPGNTANTTAWLVNAQPKTPTAVTVKQAAISIGTSAVRLTNDGSAPPSTRVLLVAQLLSTSTANCYFGSSGVTTTSTTRGVQMFPGQTFSFTNDAGDYYAICDASSQTFFVTEQE